MTKKDFAESQGYPSLRNCPFCGAEMGISYDPCARVLGRYPYAVAGHYEEGCLMIGNEHREFDLYNDDKERFQRCGGVLGADGFFLEGTRFL